MDLLTHTIAALVGGGAVYLALLPKLARAAYNAGLMADKWDAEIERDALQSELTRLTDRDELGRYVRKEPK